MSDALIECALCGKRCRSLGHHLRWHHDISADAYRDRFGIRRGTPLTSAATRARLSESIRATIAAGALDHHYAGNATRASAAGTAGTRQKKLLRAAGASFPHGTPARSDDEKLAAVRAVVDAVEGGMRVCTAVKRAPISMTAFHEALKALPEWKRRLEEAKRARRR